MGHPDYATARGQAGFSWSSTTTQGSLRAITGTPIREFNLDPEVCIDAYRRGRPLLAELFGPDVRPVPVSTPHVSYGHASALGCELLFPVGGEVCLHPIYSSLSEGLARLAEPVDFAAAGLAPFFVDFWQRLRAAFPGEPVGFTYGLEGPLTTAYEVRGIGFFTDLLDDPPLAARFLSALTESIVAYREWFLAVQGQPPVSPSGAGLCDDLASFIRPELFAATVLPYWDRFYSAATTGSRHLHCEDLRPEHLPHLETVGIARFDPSISAKLNPRLLADHCRVPFYWRMGSFHARAMSCEQIRDMVYLAAADGANGVIGLAEEILCNEVGAGKIRALIAAAKEVQALLARGVTREDLRAEVAEPERFWGNWWGQGSSVTCPNAAGSFPPPMPACQP